MSHIYVQQVWNTRLNSLSNGQREMDQRMADQALAPLIENTSLAMARSKAWNESGILARMGPHTFTQNRLLKITSVSA